MPNFKQQYKNPRPGFGEADHRRCLRAYNCDKTRREVRTRTFDRNRNLQDVSAPTTPQPDTVPTDERMKKLLKWKEERNRKKKLEAAMKKPAFKVGIVHHSLYSPVSKSDVSIARTPKPQKTEHPNHIQKRITRATEKRLLAKAAQQVTSDLTSVPTKHLMNVKTSSSNAKKQKSFAPPDHCFRPPSGLHKIPLFGRVPMKRTPRDKYTPSQKCSQTSDSTAKNYETSTGPRLSSNEQDPSQKLNKSTIRDSDELNAIKTVRSSLKEQTKNQTDIQDALRKENSFSSSSTETETPPSTPQKSTPNSSEKENCSLEDLIVFSPYLTRSRGKRNSRKEVQQRLGIGRPSDEIPTKDTVMQNLNICVEEEERTAQYFKILLNKETDRLKELCKKWLDIGLETDVPEDATYEIQTAVGQTNLLINKKFERFRGLVHDCETGKGEMLVTCRDLQGFWDMTYMEVKDCETRFEKLEQRRNREWKEEEEEEYTVTKPAVKKRMPVKKQIVSSKPSSLRSLILAARKSKMEGETLSKEDLLLHDTHINEKPSNRKFFTEENTRRSRRSKSLDLNGSESTPVRRESSKTGFVQFSDKSKKMRSPFAAMKISRMCKTPEVQLDDTVSYVNSDQTPGKSILKKSEELENKEARIKSAHKVNFDDQVVLTEVPLDEETHTKLSLAAALNRIDNFDLDDMYHSPSIHAEKRLNFEDSDRLDDLNKSISEIQTIGKRNKSRSSVQNTLVDNIMRPLNDITSSAFIEESSPNNVEIISPKKSLKNRVQHKDASNRKHVDIYFSPPTRANKDDEIDITTEIISKDMGDLDLGPRVLRNRTVPANNTPKSSRTSKMVTPKRASKEGNKKSSMKSSLKLLQKDENMTPSKSNTMDMENVTLTDNIVKKRSVRKSVAFDETCVGCAESKPVLPMTPHTVRRNKTPLRQSRSKQIDEDLISWETPDKKHPHRRRSTRSQSDKF
ncbi:uncharacterized protein LOC143894720 isoform X2 [Temnothorax americanus]|uniref:uncharacterized protein LOC143894720 isoform X2 n=1 Tax=Temnothorax americanus TaxID=1964332 RepID=UPI0040676DB9